MRKPDPDQIARANILRHQLIRHERSRAARRKAKRLNRLEALQIRRAQAAKNNILFDSNLGREQIILPANFSLHDNFAETVAAIQAVRERTLRQNGAVMLHFTQVENVDAAAALALVAEIFRIRNLRSVYAVTGTYPRKRIIYELLRDMGFYRLLDIAERDDEPKAEMDPARPIFVPFLTGNKVNPKMVDEFVQVIERHLFVLNEVARGRLVAAIIEAMNNTLDHAHPIRVFNETMTHRWWMSSWINVANNEITVLLFDQGVGIPETLDPTIYERIRAALADVIALRSISATPSDGEMIVAATEFHRSGTGHQGRGRGFRNMKQFVDTCQDGELRVLSNRGRYRYIAGTESYADESSSIGGTVIEWRFRHNGTVEMVDE